ncbi:hypothetical protein HYW11_03880 [Candidatus Peregrinibacteria bacterium]|nr:hypothetical protein [Candidatus Peregrinibacteria bacterium]
MRFLRFIAVLILLVAIAVAAWFVVRSRRAAQESPPAPYVLVEPPMWLPARTSPTTENAADGANDAEMPAFPFGARKVLRIATFRNDDAQAYGFGAVAVYERGSQVSLDVFLPPLPSGDGYDADIVMADDSVTTLGRMEDGGDGWYALNEDFPDSDVVGAAASLRITASTLNEPALDGMTVVEGKLHDAID